MHQTSSTITSATCKNLSWASSNPWPRPEACCCFARSDASFSASVFQWSMAFWHRRISSRALCCEICGTVETLLLRASRNSFPLNVRTKHHSTVKQSAFEGYWVFGNRHNIIMWTNRSRNEDSTALYTLTACKMQKSSYITRNFALQLMFSDPLLQLPPPAWRWSLPSLAAQLHALPRLHHELPPSKLDWATLEYRKCWLLDVICWLNKSQDQAATSSPANQINMIIIDFGIWQSISKRVVLSSSWLTSSRDCCRSCR